MFTWQQVMVIALTFGGMATFVVWWLIHNTEDEPSPSKWLILADLLGKIEFEGVPPRCLHIDLREGEETETTLSGHVFKAQAVNARVLFVATFIGFGIVDIPEWIVLNNSGPHDRFDFEDLGRALDCAGEKMRDAA